MPDLRDRAITFPLDQKSRLKPPKNSYIPSRSWANLEQPSGRQLVHSQMPTLQIQRSSERLKVAATPRNLGRQSSSWSLMCHQGGDCLKKSYQSSTWRRWDPIPSDPDAASANYNLRFHTAHEGANWSPEPGPYDGDPYKSGPEGLVPSFPRRSIAVRHHQRSVCNDRCQ